MITDLNENDEGLIMAGCMASINRKRVDVNKRFFLTDKEIEALKLKKEEEKQAYFNSFF